MAKVKGKKVFISYKYGDYDVQQLDNIIFTTVRDYVNKIQQMFEESPHIFRAEEDDNDLSRFKDSTIESKLRKKIYDSSITIVLISKNMKEHIPEEDQWIPWEISYSLKEHSRKERTSLSNALLAVVIPDIRGSYEYFLVDNHCPICKCRLLKTNLLFRILRENMFNIKKHKEKRTDCYNHSENNKPYSGYCSYIHTVKWSDFIDENKIDNYLNIANEINENIKDYEIVKE
jgi:hypothetical protein